MSWSTKSRPKGSLPPKRSDPALERAGAAPLRVADAMRWAMGLLSTAEVDTPRLDAELLLAHTLGCERAQVPLRWHDPLTASFATAFTALVRRRAAREPLAYILGERPFFDITLQVSPAVLVPRPETEHLIEAALAWAERQPKRPLRIIDVGTGSGAIAIVLARHLAHAQVTAVDVSLEALAVAQHNAARLGVAERITFAHSDLLRDATGLYDLIAANLPYVDRDELRTLMPEVATWEPRLALDGGPGGLELVARLLTELPARLAPDGLALLELDPRQVARAQELARRALPQAALTVIPDLAGHARVLAIARPAEQGA